MENMALLAFPCDSHAYRLLSLEQIHVMHLMDLQKSIYTASYKDVSWLLLSTTAVSQ